MDIQKKIEKYVMNESLVGEHKAQMYIDKLQQCIGSFRKTLKAMMSDVHVEELIGVDTYDEEVKKAQSLLDDLDDIVTSLEEDIFDGEK